MVFLRLLFISSFGMLLMIRGNHSALFGLKKKNTAVCHHHKDGNLADVSVLLRSAVLCTGWIVLGQVLIPEALRKTDFDMIVYHWYQRVVSAGSNRIWTNAAYLVPNSCSRCSSIIWSIVSNAADKSTRIRTATAICVDCCKEIILFFEQSCFSAVFLFICTMQNFLEPILNKVLS